jgi:hypothetical protein
MQLLSGGVAQVVECLSSKHKALSSNSTTARKYAAPGTSHTSKVMCHRQDFGIGGDWEQPCNFLSSFLDFHWSLPQCCREHLHSADSGTSAGCCSWPEEELTCVFPHIKIRLLGRWVGQLLDNFYQNGSTLPCTLCMCYGLSGSWMMPLNTVKNDCSVPLKLLALIVVGFGVSLPFPTADFLRTEQCYLLFS